MKKSAFFGLLLLFCAELRAQQNFFIYLQTDNKQPFYVRLKDKVMSSSGAGYMVIPKLTNGSYTMSIGFPKNEFPQQTVAVNIVNADAGYLVKNFGAKGWGLYNLQTMEVIMASASVNNAGDDPFANALSAATNTPVRTAPAMQEKPAAVPVVTPVATVPKTSPATTGTSVTRGAVTKLETSNSTEGYSAVYTVDGETVRVFIPAAVGANPAAETPPKVIETAVKPVVTAPSTDKKFLDIDMANPNTATSPTPAPSVQTAPAKGLAINSDCKANATDDDFLKVRKKMVGENNEDDMVNAARKFFKQKCYSVQQVKNLSVLLLTDGGKYKLFDAAYPFIYDTQNFASLQTELKENYYLKRFRAMMPN